MIPDEAVCVEQTTVWVVRCGCARDCLTLGSYPEEADARVAVDYWTGEQCRPAVLIRRDTTVTDTVVEAVEAR